MLRHHTLIVTSLQKRQTPQIMRKLFIILLSTISTSTFCQEINKENKYLADFDYLVEKLIETHPEPYKGFGGAIAFNKLKQKTSKAISDSMTNEEFVLLMNQFISNLNDGHTKLYSPKSKQELLLPILFKISADGMFVQNTNDKYSKLIGSLLLKVNNVPINELLLRTKEFEPTENISDRYNTLSQCIRNASLAEKFFGTKELHLTFKNSTGLEQSLIIPHQQNVDYIPEKTQIQFDKPNNLMFYEILGKNKNIGYFRWDATLARENIEEIYQRDPKLGLRYIRFAHTLLESEPTGDTLQDIKNIPSLYEKFYLLTEELVKSKSEYLIIDLRYNSGGSTPLVPPLLYVLYGNQYLNFDFEAEWIRRISPLYLQQIGMTSIEEYSRTYRDGKISEEYLFQTFGNYGKDIFGSYSGDMTLEQKNEKIKNGYSGLDGYSGFGAEYVKKTKSLNDIDIIVLTSPNTFSAAYHFTYFLKKLGRTTLVGVAPRQAGNAYMEATRITLPKTQLQGAISNAKQVLFDENSESAKILRPDHEMTWNDFEKYGFDVNAEVLKAIELIESKE